MNEEFEKLKDEIAQKQAEIQSLNMACAEAANKLLQGKDTRILAYSDQQKLDSVVEKYTTKIARLMVEVEELEEVKNWYLEQFGEEEHHHDHDHDHDEE